MFLADVLVLAGIFDLSHLDEFSDLAVYFSMAAIGTVLFVIRMGLMLVGGDGGLDVDIDADAIDGIPGHHGFFSLFSLLSILAFLMGAGWMGLACREAWGFGPSLSGLLAAGFGFLLMYIAALCMAAMRHAETRGNYDIADAIGKVGRIYRRVPQRGEGTGEIEVTVDGRRKVLPAVSSDGPLESFTAARVLEIEEGETLRVTPVD